MCSPIQHTWYVWLIFYFSQSVIRKLGDGIQPLADRIMTLILQLIQAAGKTSTVLEDAFLVVGSLASGDYFPILYTVLSDAAL